MSVDLTGMNGLMNTLNNVFGQVEDAQGTLGVSDIEVTGVNGDSLTVSYKDANGEVHEVEVPDIEVPAGAPTPELIESVLAKLDTLSTDIAISDESMKALQAFAAEYVAEVSEQLAEQTFNKDISVYDIMQMVLELLIKCAHEQQKLAHETKHAAQMKEYAAILAQAAAQEKNAIAGVVTAAVAGALQTMVTLAMSGGSKEVAQVNSDNGVPTALSNFHNAEQIGDPLKAGAAMNETAKSLNLPDTVETDIQNTIMPESVAAATDALTGYRFDTPENMQDPGTIAKLEQGVKVAGAKADLEAAIETGDQKQIESAQKTYLQEVDKAVDLYKADADGARKEFMAVRDNPNSTKAEIEAARENLNNAQNAYQYANSVRTNALSQAHNGTPLLTPELKQEVIDKRKDEYREAKLAAQSDPAMDKAMKGLDPITKRDMTNRLIGAIENAVQSALKLLDANATRKGAEKTRAEQEAEDAAKMLNDACELVKAALQFMDALNASTRGANMA
mgnify:CR=1 FL=1